MNVQVWLDLGVYLYEWMGGDMMDERVQEDVWMYTGDELEMWEVIEAEAKE